MGIDGSNCGRRCGLSLGGFPFMMSTLEGGSEGVMEKLREWDSDKGVGVKNSKRKVRRHYVMHFCIVKT